MKKLYYVLILLGFAVVLMVTIQCKPTTPAIAPIAGRVTGHVFAEVSAVPSAPAIKVPIPDVKVTLADAGGVLLANVKTDLDGGYRTDVLPPGTYEMCLDKDGFTRTCYKVTVMYASNTPGPKRIDFKSDNWLYGKVLLRDGTPGFYRNPVFGVDFWTNVSSDMGGAGSSVRANTSGEYLFPSLKRGKQTIAAECEKATVLGFTDLSSHTLDLVLPNTRPSIRSVNAFDAIGKSLQRTPASAMVEMRAAAIDSEGQALSYHWVPNGDYPGSAIVDAPSVKWQLPAGEARHVMYLLVTDGYGGVAYQGYDINAGEEKVKFSGRAMNPTDGSGIPNATVTVNGDNVGVTDANGGFSVAVPDLEKRRWVVNVTKAGYMLSSKIWFDEATNKQYWLVPSTTKKFDPKGEIVLVEEQDKFTRFEGKGNSRPAAEVRIPPGSIVGPDGKAFAGNVSVGVRSIDLFSELGLMPGDFGAVEGGFQKRLESFGAVDVQIRDDANPETRLKLAKGSKATIRVPIAASLLASSPATMALWDYDETDGLWKNIGTLTKVGSYYEGITSQFSSINADIAYNDATCIQLLDNPANPCFPGSPINVTVTVPAQGGGSPSVFVRNNVTAADLPLVVVRLPENTLVTVEVVQNGTTYTQIVPTRNAVPGPAQLNPDPPYTYCNDAYLKPPPVVGGAVAPTVFLSRISTLNATEADKYYQLIGAIGGDDYNADGSTNNSDRISFAQWKSKFGFGAGDDHKAAYFNAGDLAFWRGMHQQTSNISGVDVPAFYVSNFTRDDDVVADMAAPSPFAIATVCMEYSKIDPAGTTPAIKFYVFNGAGQLINAADLDGYGPKFTPGLCVECHGGDELTWTSFATGSDLQSQYDIDPTLVPRYLAFDLQTFLYPNNAGWDRGSQENELRGLNQAVLSANPTSHITEFLKKAYNVNTTTLAGNFNDNSVVPNWASATPINGIQPNNIYPAVVGPYCRTCHASRSTNPPLQFGSQVDFSGSAGSINFAVCGGNPYMPNAKVTFVNMWTNTSPFAPDQIAAFLNGAGQTCQ